MTYLAPELYVLVGKLTLADGDPGVGKRYLSLVAVRTLERAKRELGVRSALRRDTGGSGSWSETAKIARVAV